MPELLSHTVDCPYCGEHFEALIDNSEQDQSAQAISYIEDCYVCCQPIHFWINNDEHGGLTITTRSENE